MSKKITLFSDNKEQAIAIDKIKRRIIGKGRGAVFTPADFLDLGSRASVDQTLSRLTDQGVIRRLARGIYDYPKTSPRLGRLSPDPAFALDNCQIRQPRENNQCSELPPAGAAMIIALSLSITGTTLSGMTLLAVEEGQWPLAGIVATQQIGADPVDGTRAYLDDDDDDHDYGEHENEGSGEVLESVHSAFTELTLAHVALHILGVVASSIAHRETLVRAMFTGKKAPQA